MTVIKRSQKKEIMLFKHKTTHHKAPFFIIGCPRSGTTLLRDILRTHPDLCCPEETHIYNWSYPFKTPELERILVKNPMLYKHRKIDGVSSEQFEELFFSSNSRKELMDKYMNLFMQIHHNSANKRWFDKTPQNIFGVLLLMNDYPDSRFIHIIRNPLNVVASFKSNSIFKIENFIAAYNYWYESVSILNVVKPLLKNRLYEIRYEDMSDNAEVVFSGLCRFLTIDNKEISYELKDVHTENNKYQHILTELEQEYVLERSRKWLQEYHYI